MPPVLYATAVLVDRSTGACCVGATTSAGTTGSASLLGFPRGGLMNASNGYVGIFAQASSTSTRIDDAAEHPSSFAGFCAQLVSDAEKPRERVNAGIIFRLIFRSLTLAMFADICVGIFTSTSPPYSKICFALPNACVGPETVVNPATLASGAFAAGAISGVLLLAVAGRTSFLPRRRGGRLTHCTGLSPKGVSDSTFSSRTTAGPSRGPLNPPRLRDPPAVEHRSVDEPAESDVPLRSVLLSFRYSIDPLVDERSSCTEDCSEWRVTK